MITRGIGVKVKVLSPHLYKGYIGTVVDIKTSIYSSANPFQIELINGVKVYCSIEELEVLEE